VAKFHFTHWKQRKRRLFAKNLIGKCQISNSRWANAPFPPLPTPMLTTNSLFTKHGSLQTIGHEPDKA